MRKIFSLIFVFLLLTPAVAWLIDLDLELQMDRIGLKPPRFNGRALFDNEYYLSFDQYFNDNFSLRSPLILAKRWLDYRIFQTTDIEGIHVGNDGWIYSRQSIEDFRKEACNRKQDIERLVLELHAIEKMIEATGRRFFFLWSHRTNQQFTLNMWDLCQSAQPVIAANTTCFSKTLDPTP